MERLADHLMKEDSSQEEHQQQCDIGYFASNTIGYNRRFSRGSRRRRRRRWDSCYIIADINFTAVKVLNGTVVVFNIHGAVVLHGTQGNQL